MPGPKVEKCNLNINLAGILNKKISRVSDNQRHHSVNISTFTGSTVVVLGKMYNGKAWSLLSLNLQFSREDEPEKL